MTGPGATADRNQQLRPDAAARAERGLTRLAAAGAAGVGVFALIGALLGFAIVYVDYPFPYTAHRFTRSGPYFLWLVLLCGEVALWFALLPTIAKIAPWAMP